MLCAYIELSCVLALGSSEELNGLLTKARNIVSYFKRSTQAWEKLKKYQEQAGKSPKRREYKVELNILYVEATSRNKGGNK